MEESSRKSFGQFLTFFFCSADRPTKMSAGGQKNVFDDHQVWMFEVKVKTSRGVNRAPGLCQLSIFFEVIKCTTLPTLPSPNFITHKSPKLLFVLIKSHRRFCSIKVTSSADSERPPSPSKPKRFFFLFFFFSLPFSRCFFNAKITSTNFFFSLTVLTN
jgi:hypothetical protein